MTLSGISIPSPDQCDAVAHGMPGLEDCGFNGVSGPTAPGVGAWRERCRDDRDTRRCGNEEEGQAGADRGAESWPRSWWPGPGSRGWR